MQISLYHIVLIWIEIFQAPRQKDPPSLCGGFWFRNKRLSIRFPSFLGLITELLLKFAEFCWQEPCLWKEFVILRVQILHALEVSRQMILAC